MQPDVLAMRVTGCAKLCLVAVFCSSGGIGHWGRGTLGFMGVVTMGLEARAANMGEFAVAHGTTLGGIEFPTNWPATRRVILCLGVDTVLSSWVWLWCKAIAQKNLHQVAAVCPKIKASVCLSLAIFSVLLKHWPPLKSLTHISDFDQISGIL